MHFHILNCLTAILFLLLPVSLANPIEEAAKLQQLRSAKALPEDQIQNIYPRQDPTVFTTARTANTQFAPPETVTPPDPSATGTQTTTHNANTEIIPATTTGTPPPLITTDSRSANTQAVGPVTVSSGLAMPTGGVRIEAVLGAVAFGIAGMV